MMKKWTSVVAIAVLAMCAACGSESEDPVPSPSTTPGVLAPTDASLGLAPASFEGETVDPLPGIRFTLPAGAVEDPAANRSDELETVTYRMAGAEGGLPVLQVKRDPASLSDVESITWTQSQFLLNDGSTQAVSRTPESWPGAVQAVALSWTSNPEITAGAAADVLTLWLMAEDGGVYSITTMAPAGQLEDSDAYKMLLSATLVPIPAEG